MGADVIVLSEPYIDGCLGLSCCGEPFHIEDFISERSIEALVVAVFPGAPRINPDRFDPCFDQPSLGCLSNKLRAIVRPNELRLAMFEEQRIERFQHVRITHAELHRDTQGFTGIFIKDGQC